MAVNARQKGKRGELLAVKYLQSLGFDARRRQQYCGTEGADDVAVELPNGVHVEVKCGYAKCDLGTKLLASFVDQAQCDSLVGTSHDGRIHFKSWLVLWKPDRKPWRATFVADTPPVLVTACGDAEIKTVLMWLGGAQ